MRAERFGSYSMLFTTAGIPSFVLLKSIKRKRLLWPPPTFLTVILPRLLRPPLVDLPTTRDFSGTFAVILSNEPIILCLCPGVVGFNLRIAILFLDIAK